MFVSSDLALKLNNKMTFSYFLLMSSKALLRSVSEKKCYLSHIFPNYLIATFMIKVVSCQFSSVVQNKN